MTGKEALYNIELARITEYKKDGIYTKDIRDTTEYRVIQYELDELTKYKRVFEVFKRLDGPSRALLIAAIFDIATDEEYELLEELMEDE